VQFYPPEQLGFVQVVERVQKRDLETARTGRTLSGQLARHAHHHHRMRRRLERGAIHCRKGADKRAGRAAHAGYGGHQRMTVGDARDLPRLLPGRWHGRIGCVVCGIPLALLALLGVWMPQTLRDILEQAARIVRPLP